MYDTDEMTTLHTAAECREVAELADVNRQVMAVAYAINNAANCGETRVEFVEPLLPAVSSELESNGYVMQRAGGAYEDKPTIISWDK